MSSPDAAVSTHPNLLRAGLSFNGFQDRLKTWKLVLGEPCALLYDYFAQRASTQFDVLGHPADRHLLIGGDVPVNLSTTRGAGGQCSTWCGLGMAQAALRIDLKAKFHLVVTTHQDSNNMRFQPNCLKTS